MNPPSFQSFVSGILVDLLGAVTFCLTPLSIFPRFTLYFKS